MQKGGGGVVLPALQVSMRKRDGFVPCQQAVVDGEEHVLTLALEPTKEGASGAVWITSLVRIRLALVTKVSLVLNNNSGSPADSFVALSVRDREEDICLKTTSSSTSAVRDLLSNAVAAASGRKRAETRSLDLVVSARAPQLGFGATLQAYLFKLNSKGWKRCFFQLNGAALTYYADEKACTQGLGLGFLDLSQLTLAQTTGHNVQAGTALLSTFRLQISHAREWFIGADDTADAMIWLGQITSAMKRARPKGPHLFVPNAPKEAESQVWARVSSALGCYEADAEEKPRAATEESRRLAKALLLMLDEAENSPETEAASSDVMEQVDSLTNQIFDDATLTTAVEETLHSKGCDSEAERALCAAQLRNAVMRQTLRGANNNDGGSPRTRAGARLSLASMAAPLPPLPPLQLSASSIPSVPIPAPRQNAKTPSPRKDH